jgi:hypothetical protein
MRAKPCFPTLKPTQNTALPAAQPKMAAPYLVVGSHTLRKSRRDLFGKMENIGKNQDVKELFLVAKVEFSA